MDRRPRSASGGRQAGGRRWTGRAGEAERASRYRHWLESRAGGTGIHLRHERLTGPTEYGEIYAAAVRACEQALAASRDAALTFHLSPGTPAMAAVWIILAKTRFPAAMIESSREHGVRTVSVPFDTLAEFLPDLLRQSASVWTQALRIAGPTC